MTAYAVMQVRHVRDRLGDPFAWFHFGTKWGNFNPMGPTKPVDFIDWRTAKT